MAAVTITFDLQLLWRDLPVGGDGSSFAGGNIVHLRQIPVFIGIYPQKFAGQNITSRRHEF
jgi:hypothetical protein